MFNITLPAILMGIFFSTIYGAVFHLWKNGGFLRLLLYIILSWVGFWVGHLLGATLKWTFLSIGPLRFGMATLGSLIFISGGHWLSLETKE